MRILRVALYITVQCPGRVREVFVRPLICIAAVPRPGHGDV